MSEMSVPKPNALLLRDAAEEKVLYFRKGTIVAQGLLGVRQENYDKSFVIGLRFISGTYCIEKINIAVITEL
jgi:hypothetical protein